MDCFKAIKEYAILNIIGKGTYGTIFLCRKHKDDSFAVLKEINISSSEENQHKEAENEILVLSKLNHPNVIKFYESFVLNNCIYIAMEYAIKGNLAEFMYERQSYFLPSNDVLYIFCQILMGVEHIHKRNIIHRDIKAENIFLSGYSGAVVKIGDFGISKILGNDKTSTVIGTPYYLAPELCENKPYDTKTDVWALGCLLYEMCTHQRAFDATTLVGLIRKIISGKFEPINKEVYESTMQELIDNMLTVDPEQRLCVSDILKKPFLFPMLCYLQSAMAHICSYN